MIIIIILISKQFQYMQLYFHYSSIKFFSGIADLKYQRVADYYRQQYCIIYNYIEIIKLNR